MSFDRASAFYMGACQILSDEDQDMTPGERAVIYASLAQVEAIMGLTKMITTLATLQAGNPPPEEVYEEAARADGDLGRHAARLVGQIADDPRDP